MFCKCGTITPNYTHQIANSSYIVFPGLFFILLSHFFSFMVVRGLGLGSMGVGLGLGFSVDWVWDLWCGALWVFWEWCSPYKHRKTNLGKIFLLRETYIYLRHLAHAGYHSHVQRRLSLLGGQLTS